MLVYGAQNTHQAIGKSKEIPYLHNMTGIILKDGFVKATNRKRYRLEWRSTDSDGFHKVLIDAKAVGGGGYMGAQSIKPFIGATVEFEISRTGTGYNYVIIKLA